MRQRDLAEVQCVQALGDLGQRRIGKPHPLRITRVEPKPDHDNNPAVHLQPCSTSAP